MALSRGAKLGPLRDRCSPRRSWAQRVAGTTRDNDYGTQNGLINLSMADDAGHQLPNITYPGLDEAELVDAVERFYSEYYFRPRVVWRVVSKAIFNSHERRRLAKEAREYLSLRSKRKRFVVNQRKGVAARAATD